MLSNSFKLFGFHVFSGLIAPDESYSRNSSCLLNLIDLRSYYYNWVNTFADGLLVPEGVIRPVVSVSTLSWCALKLISTFLLDMSHCTLTPKSIGGSRRGWAGGGTLYGVSYRLVICVLTEYFQFRPCHFSFYIVL